MSKLKARAAVGDASAILEAARSVELAGGNPGGSPLVKQLTELFEGSSGEEPDDSGAPPVSDPSGEGGGGATEPDAGGGRSGEGQATSGGGVPAPGDPKTVTKTSTTASQKDENGHYTVTVVTSYSDGSTKTVVTEKDDSGNVVSVTTTETDADGNSTTLDAGEPEEEAEDEDEDSLTTGDEAGAFTADPSVMERPTHHQMLEHPTNDPEDGADGTSDIDFDGRPDVVAGHLDGRIDPSPEGEAVGIFLSLEQALQRFNVAGPETGPPDQQEPHDTGPLSPDAGNGPIENPQLSMP